MNKTLCRRAIEARFVTAFYGQLQPGGALAYCNAGHNPPFLFSNLGTTRLETGGSVLGMFDYAHFDTGATEFQSGDLLILFSDGVTEAENDTGEEFGDDRLAACVSRVRTRSAPEVLEAVQREVRTFCGSAAPRDDVTVMVVKAQ